MELGKHITLSEACKSETALKLGIQNKPNEQQLKAMLGVVDNIFDPCCDYFKIPAKVTSFFRSPELNKKIGGSATSQHQLGEAIDFEFTGVANKDLAKYIHDNLDYDQIILEFYDESSLNSGWVHASYRYHGNRRQCLQAYKEKGKTHYKLLNLQDYKPLYEKKILQKENCWSKMGASFKRLTKGV